MKKQVPNQKENHCSKDVQQRLRLVHAMHVLRMHASSGEVQHDLMQHLPRLLQQPNIRNPA
jgi:hypothetical protein